MQWKKQDYTQHFKLASPRGSLDIVSAIILDIINKIIVQDISSKSKLSTRKYLIMMALDDEVEAIWADYIFSRLLESVHRNNNIKTSRTFENDVMFGLLISNMLEMKILVADWGEQFVDTDHIPHKNIKNKPQPVKTVPHRLPKRIVKGKGKGKKTETESASSSASSSSSFEEKRTEIAALVPPSPSSPIIDEETRQKKKDTEKLFKELERIDKTEASQTSKKNRSTPSKLSPQTVEQKLRDENEESEVEALPPKKKKVVVTTAGVTKMKRTLKKKKPPTPAGSVHSDDPVLQYVESYMVVEVVARTPYHRWDTKGDSFSISICLSFEVINPGIGLPHSTATVQHICNWCLPLETISDKLDLITMARDVTNEIEAVNQSALTDIFGEGLTQSVRHDVLHFQRWLYWSH